MPARSFLRTRPRLRWGCESPAPNRTAGFQFNKRGGARISTPPKNQDWIDLGRCLANRQSFSHLVVFPGLLPYAAVLLFLLRMLSPPVHFRGVLQARLALRRQTGISRSSGLSAEHSLRILIANFLLFLCREIEFLEHSECLRESELRKV